MPQLMIVNPRRRKAKRKTRSPAQRAATARMLAANRARRNPAPKRRRPKARAASVAVATRRYRRKSASGSVKRYVRRARARASTMGKSLGFSLPKIQHAVTQAAIAGAGAVAVDVLMGQAVKFLPATWATRYSADGTVNWAYYASKSAVAIGMAVAGAKFLPGKAKSAANTMALGSLTVMTYELMRGMIPADMLTLGFMSPGRVVGGSDNVTSLGKYLEGRRAQGGFGKYLSGMTRPARVGEGPIQ